MTERSFRLIPFPSARVPSVSLTGRFSFENRILSLHYSLVGDLEDIFLPPISPDPARRDELWKATCFEFFLAVRDEPGYWEFNISPSGDWNVYRMDAYRRVGFREETLLSWLHSEFKELSAEYWLDVSVDLTPLIRPGHEMFMAITAILQTKDGSETYWALAHPAAQADFHLREGFILPLARQTHPSERSARAG